jgi:His/Glu/Gln/Arg/opine family amino acid ABC transporter permease subunit
VVEFDFSPILESWRFLAAGLLVTISLSAAVIVSATVLGVLVGIARTYGPGWLKAILTFYVDSMRALPVLVVLVWTFFAFPLALGVTMPPLIAAYFALTLHVGSYVSEIMRAGIESVRAGQMRAALALGMSGGQAIRGIILPQAAIRMLPPYATIVTMTIKETAVAAVIAVPEFMRSSEVVSSQSLRPLEVYTVALVVYFILMFPVARGVDRIYRRLAHLGRS